MWCESPSRNRTGGPFLPAKLVPFLAATDTLYVKCLQEKNGATRRDRTGDLLITNQHSGVLRERLMPASPFLPLPNFRSQPPRILFSPCLTYTYRQPPLTPKSAFLPPLDKLEIEAQGSRLSDPCHRRTRKHSSNPG